jgi:putative membrane protein
MIPIQDFPHILALLNALTLALLVTGYVFIRRGEQARHRAVMISALVVSAVFLAVYLVYHANAGLAKFGGEGWIRPVYFTILIAHVVGSALIVILVPATAYFSLTGRIPRHRAIARWTLPIWIYVAASGVVVYVMAVHLYPMPHG